ncbi:MAG: pyridoxal phosphate-dependent aminotransferase [Thermoplasmata archaeon]|nr:pyridoxal phosphate-dependent aminotransferase [Thermoplasmata archaeon]
MRQSEGSRGFPLGRWVDAHSSVRHNLALSGMAGALRTVPRVLRDPPAATPEDLRTALARIHGVDPADLFLTHGAHEANFLALAFLMGGAQRSSRRLTVRVDLPEYPPLLDMARGLGGRVVPGERGADVWLVSNPNNPTGRSRSAREIEGDRRGASCVIVDEAFREFTEAPSIAGAGEENLWATGTFTKVYGADQIRVGWSIPPRPVTAAYARFHPVASDKVAERSVRAAMAILSARAEVLREVRGIFGPNVRALRNAVPGCRRPAGPTWLDRGRRGLPGDKVQAAALRRSILVSSGAFFGDPTGVRICMTRRSFPEDLTEYLAVRARFMSRS